MIYFSRYEANYNDCQVKGNFLNAKHLEYVKIGVYNELYKKVLSLYFSDNLNYKMKHQKLIRHLFQINLEQKCWAEILIEY